MSGITMKSSTADFSAVPLGFVNITPLPDDLPAGLSKLLLTRKSTAASSFDRLSGDPSVLQTMKDGSGDITFSATHLTVEDTASGLIDTSFVNSYEDGFTIIGVMRFDQVGTDDAHFFQIPHGTIALKKAGECWPTVRPQALISGCKPKTVLVTRQ